MLRHRSFSILGYEGCGKSYMVDGVSSFDNALSVTRGPKVDAEGTEVLEYRYTRR